MFVNVSRSRLPDRSAKAMRCGSRTLTNPGWPPRGEASQPLSDEVAITKNGDMAMKPAAPSSTWSMIFLRSTSDGNP